MLSTIAIKDSSMEKFSTGFQSLREVKRLMSKIFKCAFPWRNKILGLRLPCGKVYNRNTEVLPKSSPAATKASVCSPLVSVYTRRKCSACNRGQSPLQRSFEGGVKGQALLSHSAVCDGFMSAREHGCYCLGSYHLTARFCTSPFLSSSNFKSIFTTFFSLSSSSFIESFCSSIIRSLVAINLKGHREKVHWLMCRHKCITFASSGQNLSTGACMKTHYQRVTYNTVLRKRKITILQVDNYLTGVR